MSPFLDDLHFDNAGMRNGRRCIILTSHLRAITSLGMVEAPAGFMSDGGSIPKIAWSIVGDGYDECLEEFVIHDLLYSPLNREYSRSEADFILKELLWNRHAPAFKREAFWMAVRAFGKSRFKAQVRTLPGK